MLPLVASMMRWPVPRARRPSASASSTICRAARSFTEPVGFNDVVKALEEKGYTFASAEIEMVPQTYVTLTAEGDLKNMQKLIDFLEDNDDVQNVWHNWNQD